MDFSRLDIVNPFAVNLSTLCLQRCRLGQYLASMAAIGARLVLR